MLVRHDWVGALQLESLRFVQMTRWQRWFFPSLRKAHEFGAYVVRKPSLVTSRRKRLGTCPPCFWCFVRGKAHGRSEVLKRGSFRKGPNMSFRCLNP